MGQCKIDFKMLGFNVIGGEEANAIRKERGYGAGDSMLGEKKMGCVQ